MISLIFKNIEDPYILENFQRLSNFLNSDVMLMGNFKFYTLTFTGAVTNYRFKHNLDFVPKDLILTSITGSATVTINYDLFTKDYIDITTSGGTTIRFLVGSMRNDL